MMTTGTPNWTTLNAYVDGELDPVEAADVARAAGQDAGVADQIAALYRIKGNIQAAMPPAPADLAGLLPPAPGTRRREARWRAPVVTVAIATLVAACAGVLFLAQAMLFDEEPASNAMNQARLMHERWLMRDAGQPVDPAPVVLAALSRFGHVPLVPDLESTGLAIGLVTLSGDGDGRMLQIGYRGHHGCHLSLFVFAGGQGGTAAGQALQASELARAWNVGDLSYLLFAKGMDHGRFALIGEKVEQATRANAPLDTRARAQLAQNKLHSTSCHA